ncbi:Protein disulfide-isomerase 5-4 [Globisporangium polare]
MKLQAAVVLLFYLFSMGVESQLVGENSAVCPCTTSGIHVCGSDGVTYSDIGAKNCSISVLTAALTSVHGVSKRTTVCTFDGATFTDHFHQTRCETEVSHA